jgi:hypothetical protein
LLQMRSGTDSSLSIALARSLPDRFLDLPCLDRCRCQGKHLAKQVVLVLLSLFLFGALEELLQLANKLGDISQIPAELLLVAGCPSESLYGRVALLDDAAGDCVCASHIPVRTFHRNALEGCIRYRLLD